MKRQVLGYVATPDNNPVWPETYADALASPSIGLGDWFNALPPYVSQLPVWQFGARSVSNNVFTFSHSICARWHSTRLAW
jgi:hypothetical protein